MGRVLAHLSSRPCAAEAPQRRRYNEDGSAKELDSLSLEQRYEFDVRLPAAGVPLR
jgi:hypothetical protein